jgi:hypothetical protein
VALRMIREQDARGMVTAELAVTTLAAFALLTTMCWGIYLVVTQLRCVDTAAAIARQAARGGHGRGRQGQSCGALGSDDRHRRASESGHSDRAGEGSTARSLVGCRAARGSGPGGSGASCG